MISALVALHCNCLDWTTLRIEWVVIDWFLFLFLIFSAPLCSSLLFSAHLFSFLPISSHLSSSLHSFLSSPLLSSLLFFCRSFHKGDIVSSSRVIVGVDAAIADAASLALMVESVGLGTEQWKDAVKRWIPLSPFIPSLTSLSLSPLHALFFLWLRKLFSDLYLLFFSHQLVSAKAIQSLVFITLSLSSLPPSPSFLNNLILPSFPFSNLLILFHPLLSFLESFNPLPSPSPSHLESFNPLSSPLPPPFPLLLPPFSNIRGQSCRISYSSSKEDMLAAGDLIMCRYVMKTEGFDTAGALR